MIKTLLLMFCSVILPAAIAFATPPTSITLTYDMSKGSLHVEAEHISFDVNKSYVRLMNIYVNGNQVSTTDYFKQDDPEKFIEDMPVTAQVGDVIKVELFCSLGGDLSQELTVEQPGVIQPGQGADTGTTNSIAENSVNS